MKHPLVYFGATQQSNYSADGTKKTRDHGLPVEKQSAINHAGYVSLSILSKTIHINGFS
jgi:hypothetical protein